MRAGLARVPLPTSEKERSEEPSTTVAVTEVSPEIVQETRQVAAD